MKPVIIGLGHEKGVGKDQLATFTISYLRSATKNLRIVRRGFVEEAYNFLHTMYGWAGFDTYQYYVANPSAKERVLPLLGKTPRSLVIELGILTRQIDINFWLNGNLRRDDYDILFVSDLRYPIEFDGMEALGAHLIRIHRPGFPIYRDEPDDALLPYKDRWHEQFDNSGSLSDLHAYAQKLGDRILMGKLKS